MVVEEEEGVVLIFVPASGDRIDRYIWAIGETGRQRRVCENITGGGRGAAEALLSPRTFEDGELRGNIVHVFICLRRPRE